MHMTTADRRQPRARPAAAAGPNPAARGYGRFVRADPIGYDDGLNLYNYVASDPVNATDPSGTTIVSEPGGLSPCVFDGRCRSRWGGVGGDIVFGQDANDEQEVVVTGKRRGDGGNLGSWYVGNRTLDEWALGSLNIGGSLLGGMSAGQTTSKEKPQEGEVVVTGRWLLKDGKYVLNRSYRPAWWDRLEYAIIVPPLLGAAAAVSVSGPALFAGRQVGLLNSNRYLRIGWGPGKNATKVDFYQSFRIVIGNRKSSFYRHFDLPGIRK